MLLAIIWNIKHSIEISIKALGINIDRKYMKIHNLNTLINDCEKRIKEHCLQEDFNRFKCIVKKYYENDFLSQSLFGGKKKIDKNNTNFRYMDDLLEKSVFDNIKEADLDEFLVDIKNIKKLFGTIWNQKLYYEHGKDNNIKKEIIDKKINSVENRDK